MLCHFHVCLLALVGFCAAASAQGVKTDLPGGKPTPGKDAAYWIKILEKGDDLLAQEEALEVLGKLGPAARWALPALKRIADDAKSALRKKAVMTIFRIDPKADVSPAILLDGLKDASAQEKLQCAVLLARAAANSATLTKQVLDAFPDLDPGTRALLVERLIGLSPTVYPVLEQAFGHKDPRVRAGALAVADKMTAEVAKSLPKVQTLLKDPDLGVRFEAARIVWRLDAKKNERQLAGIFKEAAQDPEIRASFFAFLKAAQPPLRDASLYELALKDGPPDVRLQAIEGLAELGKSSKELYAPLLEVVRTDVGQRAKALRLLGRVCPRELKETLPELIGLFQKRQDNVVEIELYKLFIQCGADAVDPLMDLIKKEKTRDVFNMHPVYNALARIGAPAVDPVVRLLDSEEPAHPKVALRILGGMGPAAKPAVPRVVRLLNDPALGDAAMTCLGSIGAGARSAAADLARLVQDNRQPRGRYKAVEQLIQIFPAPDELLPVLRKVAADPADLQNRLKAVEALWAWEGDAKKLAPVLKDILTRQQGYLPAEYWKLLRHLGRDIEPLLPDMFAQLKKRGSNDHQILHLLSEVAPRVKYRPTAQEVAKLTDIFQEKGPEGFRNYDARKVEAALASIGFDHEKDKAVAVLKEELGKAKTPPMVLLLDRLPPLGSKLKGIVPDLMAMMPRLQYGHENLLRALASIDPEGMKALRADLEKNVRTSILWTHPHAELLVRIEAKLEAKLEAKHSEAWRVYEKTLNNPNDTMLLQALRSLETLGAKAKHLAPLVEKHLTHPKITTRQAAAVCLWHITGDTKKTVPVLVAALKEQVSWHGGNELTRMGVGARAAVPELMSLAETEHGPTAKFLRDFAFQIDRAAAFAWWSQRDHK